MNWPVTILIASAAFALGWWVSRRSVQGKIDELYAKVEAGKEKVQGAIDANK